MQIEAFSKGKDPALPHANEDRFVILPGLAYAIIDGATDRLGTRYDGMLSGQYGAFLAGAGLERALSTDPGLARDGAALIRAVTAAIRDGYRRHGTDELARSDPNHRFSATMALCLTVDDRLDVWLVGDSGVRLNGEHVLQEEKDLDRITSMLRQQAWPFIAASSQDPIERERLSRLMSFRGTRQDPAALAPFLDATDLAEIERVATAACAARLPHVPEAHIANLVRGGIVNAQGGYQNDPSSVLGYSCMDGFDVPIGLVRHESFKLSDVATIELFSDGYFQPGDGFGVDAWEESFRFVEREDPEKVRRWLSPKGSTSLQLADDRTYLGIRLAE